MQQLDTSAAAAGHAHLLQLAAPAGQRACWELWARSLAHSQLCRQPLGYTTLAVPPTLNFIQIELERRRNDSVMEAEVKSRLTEEVEAEIERRISEERARVRSV